MQKWPNERFVKTRAVSGFIFLRLLCPAILNPRSFNLISGKNESNTDLTLTIAQYGISAPAGVRVFVQK